MLFSLLLTYKLFKLSNENSLLGFFYKKIYFSWQILFSSCVNSEGGNKFILKITCSYFQEEEIMMEIDEKRNMKEFDSYCKKVLRNEATNLQKELERQRDHEISLSDLSEIQLNQLIETNDYITDRNYFQVLGEQIALRNDQLTQALKMLDKNKREIILLPE